ncbi:tRNA (adenine(22)-N(1))-methyltransferase [Paenibacillus sp. TAB 01]|uniref:tRNA (adenine(22)-N(1))-methyltransferase n=1 Tax=Paenibacillus sp. TAB 01 TaxID=3368988 RepID=UPI0037509C6E
MLKISKRLEMIAGQVPSGSRMADIGSDHALLPTFLALQGKITKAVAGEVNPGPFQAAAKQVKEAQLQDRIEVRLGDGLAVISPDEVDVITIAGMGGALIASILEAGKAKLSGVGTLVLQPNVGESIVRSWLIDNDWILTGEQILEEDHKIYEILTAVPKAQTELDNEMIYRRRELVEHVALDRELLLKLGPYFIDRPDEVWFRKWSLELDKLDKIRRQMAMSDLDEAKRKRQELEEEMRQIREVLACLQKDRR